MKYLWNEWNVLKPSLLSSKRKLIMLDFDGTLAPIAKSPDAVRFDQKTRRALQILSRSPHHQLVIISGRKLKELYRYFQMKNVLYAGNHGLEIKGKNFTLPKKAKAARKLRGFIKFLAQRLKSDFDCYPGVLVEDKNFTLSLHFRKLPKEQTPLFKELVKFYQKKYKHKPLVWIKGKKVWEVYPSTYWGKGEIVLHLLKKFPGALPIALGDDKSDNSMFVALKRKGVTIHVGQRLRSSSADYYLRSTHDVRGFLQKLCP